MSYFVVSDIHGCLKNFEELLKNFNPNKQQLILLGDYVDRGPDSVGVLKRIKQLKEQYPETILLMGNHDERFLKFMMDELAFSEVVDYLSLFDGKKTIESFTDEPIDTSDKKALEVKIKQIRLEMMSQMQGLIEFFKGNLKYFYETENILFTHAGYNTTIANWKKTTDEEFIWIRKHYKNRPKTHHTNVFGHTFTQSIREERGEGYSHNPLLIEHSVGSYLAIDGGCAFGGQLNGVVLNEHGDLVKTYISK